MNSTNDIQWNQDVWKGINEGVMKEMAKVRKAQWVFSHQTFDNNPMTVPNEVIDFSNLSIQDGSTKNFVEIYQEFSLSNTQIQNEAVHNTCQTLARMAAKAVALGEDAYFFQVSDRSPEVRDIKNRQKFQVRFPGGVKINNWKFKEDFGLLAEANPSDASDDDISKVSLPIEVDLSASDVTSVIWGEETFKAVTKGISKLVAKGQAPNYALFLSTSAYADTFAPPSPASLVTTADRIKPLVEGGFYDSAVLPQNEGLLIALAGEPQKLYVGQEANTEFVRQEGSTYFFRVVERVQYVVRDPRSMVLLKFKQPDAD
jgi:uncharacterized linocin/CFP29 family protein